MLRQVVPGDCGHENDAPAAVRQLASAASGVSRPRTAPAVEDASARTTSGVVSLLLPPS